MYSPFIRGKQFELSSLRELAPRLSNIVYQPIIEPVRKNLLPLVKTIKELNEHNVDPIIIINPDIGDFYGEHEILTKSLFSLDNKLRFIPCIKISENTSHHEKVSQEFLSESAVFISDILEKKHIEYLKKARIAIIPKGTIDAELQLLNKNVILIDDPFQKKSRNADYKEKSKFSDLHLNYRSRPNVIGFSDYTIVGSDYSEAGGPAYVVTIHLSYIEKEYNQMLVRHFSSDQSNSPANPGGKFDEALERCIRFIKSSPDIFDNTLGFQELNNLYTKRHFPGLGYIKKISIEHHIETICNYLTR